MHGGESVTFVPKVGDSVTFSAKVVRQGLTTAATGAERALRRRALVILPHADENGENGITGFAEGDRLLCVLQRGRPAQSCRIINLVTENAGGYHVEVQG